MKYLIFDTETTGLAPGQICQLSYIIDEDGSATSANYYFKVSHIEPGAQRVHALSVKALETLSGGHNFEYHSDEILTDFESSDCMVAYNFDFDKSFILAEFRRIAMKPRIKSSFCTMKHFAPICKFPSHGIHMNASGYKYPGLSELTRFLCIPDAVIARRASELFGLSGKESFHDARFDATAAYLCFKSGCMTKM